MQEILSLQKKIVPELVEVLEKRYSILRTIYYNQPIGRRVLANQLDLGERIVRTEISFLKSQNLIEINTPGMTVTEEGQEVVDKLKDFIHEIKGLSDIEASTLAASLAKKLNGAYKLLHLPENLSLELLDTLLKEKEIKEVIDNIHKADILIYGIGDALVMAEKRDVSEEEFNKLKSLGAVGEAFGCYFNKDSKVVSENTSIGININEARKINTHIAVAAGENKVDAIIATMMKNQNAVLITDEAAGRKIVEFIKEHTKQA